MRNTLSDAIQNIEDIESQLQYNKELLALFIESDTADKQSDEILNEILSDLQNIVKKAKQTEVEYLFSGEDDNNSCFLEIHSGAGGTESDDWASILFRMYSRWAERHKYKITIVNYLSGEEAGIKSVTLKIEGSKAYGWLKTESGIHRLVRISPFNSAGKRHTSFASIWVYPLIDDSIEIDIDESQLRIDTYRSSGAGGQHVNTTDSAVRITHIPTGIVVQSQNDRSQHRNKDECMKMLRSRLYELALKKRTEDTNRSDTQKPDIGWGHQIRSYVLHPYQMVKDLRSNHETGNVTAVLNGEIDDFIHSNLSKKLNK